MNWFTSMTWYQQAATSFFLGFCPVMAASLIVRAVLDERKILRMQGSYRDGILVRPDKNPVTPTIVFAWDYKTFADFCRACRLNANSAGVVFAGANEPTPFSRTTGFSPLNPADKHWEHIAFVLIDPEGYYTARSDNAWGDIEHMRRNNQFTRAFYYPDIYHIRPNVTDEGRPWV